MMTNSAENESGEIFYSNGTDFVPEAMSLVELCNMLTSCKCPYEDIAELIEDKAYEECENGNLETAISELCEVASFIESLENKNEENSRDLADIYLLIGQINQFTGHFTESIGWFSKAIVIDDQYSEPYHCLAISLYKQGKHGDAIKSIETELTLSPGNYYSYLLLAELYQIEDRHEDTEKVLKVLLERDTENIQGLHRLIQFYEKSDAEIKTDLLVKRLLNIKKKYSAIEILIRSFYLYRSGKIGEALEFVDLWLRTEPNLTLIHLIRAYLFNSVSNDSSKNHELTLFSKKNRSTNSVMKSQIDEFGAIYGESASNQVFDWLIACK